MEIWLKLLLFCYFFMTKSCSQDTFMFTELKLQSLMTEAKILNPFLEYLLVSMSGEFNIISKHVKSIMGPLKTRERAISKLVDEKGLDLLEIHDLSRGSLIFLNMGDMYSALDKFRHIPYINITKINDKFSSSHFYKDINMNFYYENSTTFYTDQGHPFHLNLEVQFHICHLYHAKLIDDPVYHVRRLAMDENSAFFPNTFQTEVDSLFMKGKLQQKLFGSEFFNFKNSYFSLLTCEQMGELYCQIYWDNLMQTLNSMSWTLYSKAWNNYLEHKTCNLESFPPKNMDISNFI